MKKAMNFLLAAAMATGMIAGVSTVAYAEDDTITIGYSCAAIESQMLVEYQRVIRETCDEMGVEYIEVIADNDVQKQNQQIENLISSGCDAIIIFPADGEAVVAAIEECNEAGVPVVMANRAAGEGAEVVGTVTSDNEAMVTREMQYVIDKAKEDGTTFKAIKLVGGLTDANAIARDNGFNAVAEANPDVLEVASEVPTEWKGELALAGVLSAFEENPDINLIFSPSDALLPSILSGLQQLDKYYKIGEEGHITIVTFDGAADAVNAIKEGYVDIVSVQDATNQARLCVEAAVAAAKGEEVESLVDPGFEVTSENVEELGFEGY